MGRPKGSIGRNRLSLEPLNPSGLCFCGCGQRTPIAQQGLKRDQWVKGQPIRFIPGHQKRKPEGNKFINREGYVLVKQTGHPRSDNSGYVFEHVLVMEKVLGRPILSTEAIHHIDEVRHNNDPGNLMLFAKRGMHSGFHRDLEFRTKMESADV
jgi:hypothetical protein